jgi:hypothetical protein
MANLGCILGCITVDAGNSQLSWVEDPLGTPVQYTTTITVGDYFPDSATAGEDLAVTIKDAMDAASAWTYFVTYDGATGLFTVLTAGGRFQLNSGTPTSLWPSCGFSVARPLAELSGGNYTMTAEASPLGTWLPQTVDSMEEIRRDTHWSATRKGVSREGTIGKRYTKTWAVVKRRAITYGPICGPNAFAVPLYDIDRAQTCFDDHWSKGMRVRVYTASRTVTTATNNDTIFDAVVMNESLDLKRVADPLDWWDVSLDLQAYVT